MSIHQRVILGIVVGLQLSFCMAQTAMSPNRRLTLVEKDSTIALCCEGRQVVEIAGAPKGSLTFVRTLKEDYTMLSGKRLHCSNEANEYVVKAPDGQLELRLYNDGLAFRTSQPREMAYLIPEGTRRWMMQWTDAYEGFFPLSTTYRVEPVPSFSGVVKSAEGWNVRWAYPALLEPADDLFALISEANIEHGQSASSLYNDGEYYRIVPDKATEQSPYNVDHSPFRVVIVGSLADIVQSTLITDVSEPCRLEDVSWIHPGTVSWVYWAYNHGSNDYNIIKKYVDMAVTLRLPYVLIDAEWDEMKDGKTIEDAVSYALSQGVRPLIWYNSSVGWIDGAPGPKFRLNKPEDREREFAWCEKIGIAGIFLGTLISTFPTSFWVEPYVTHKYGFHKPVRYFFFKYALYAFSVVCVGSFTYRVCSYFTMGGILEVFLKLVVCVLLYVSITVLLFFKTKEFKKLRSQFMIVLDNFKKAHSKNQEF